MYSNERLGYNMQKNKEQLMLKYDHKNIFEGALKDTFFS